MRDLNKILVATALAVSFSSVAVEADAKSALQRMIENLPFGKALVLEDRHGQRQAPEAEGRGVEDWTPPVEPEESEAMKALIQQHTERRLRAREAQRAAQDHICPTDPSHSICKRWVPDLE